MPWEVLDAQSINAVVRTRADDGSVSAATAVSVPVIPQNPGIFCRGGAADPRPGIVYHGSAFAGTVSVDGSTAASNIATVRIQGPRVFATRSWEGDTLERAGPADRTDQSRDPEVEAFAAGSFTRTGFVHECGARATAWSIRRRRAREDRVIMTATT
ncbi:MAG: hypothetical protein R2762_20875 [Bryobacteraceae bacterium]